MKKRILCFGDSNTWGYMPGTGDRYPEDVRWTGVVKKLLGEDFEIIEDGIPGRCTCDGKPWSVATDGLQGIDHALKAHYPLDCVVVMLGTNDLFDHNAAYAKNGVDEIVRRILYSNTYYATATPMFKDKAKVLLVSPILIAEDIDSKGVLSYIGTHNESKKFKDYYYEIVKARNIDFIDASQYAYPSEIDGLHLTADGHISLGKAIAEKLKDMYK